MRFLSYLARQRRSSPVVPMGRRHERASRNAWPRPRPVGDAVAVFCDRRTRRSGSPRHFLPCRLCSIDKKKNASYRKQIARQNSRHKNFDQIKGGSRPYNILPLIQSDHRAKFCYFFSYRVGARRMSENILGHWAPSEDRWKDDNLNIVIPNLAVLSNSTSVRTADPSPTAFRCHWNRHGSIGHL